MKLKESCEHCLIVNGREKFRRTAAMPLNGRIQGIDFCIHHIVAALNAGNIPTSVSCCGHGYMYGNIGLEDGRVLVIHPETPKSAAEWSELVTEGRLRRIHEG